MTARSIGALRERNRSHGGGDIHIPNLRPARHEHTYTLTQTAVSHATPATQTPPEDVCQIPVEQMAAAGSDREPTVTACAA